jgi:hypothetical protein
LREMKLHYVFEQFMNVFGKVVYFFRILRLRPSR